jgi:hypothetical protein
MDALTEKRQRVTNGRNGASKLTASPNGAEKYENEVIR